MQKKSLNDIIFLLEKIWSVARSMRDVCRINNDQLDFSFNKSFENIPDYQLHCHNIYEIYYFVDGAVEYMVEGRMYYPSPCSMMLIRPGVVHGVKVSPKEKYSRYAFHFTPEVIPAEHRAILLAPFYEDKFYYENVFLQSTFDLVLDSKKLSKKIQNIAISSRFESLLTQIYSLKDHLSDDVDVFDGVGKIVAYINENLANDIDLEDISGEFFISKSSLNRLFKKHMNTTIGAYISLKRVSLARELLHSGEPAERVATRTGFKDYSTFYRTYKKVMGHSPAKSLEYNLLIDPSSSENFN